MSHFNWSPSANPNWRTMAAGIVVRSDLLRDWADEMVVVSKTFPAT
jgi:hypothetical protein